MIEKIKKHMIELGWRGEEFDTEDGFRFLITYHLNNSEDFLEHKKLNGDIEQSIGFLIDVSTFFIK